MHCIQLAPSEMACTMGSAMRYQLAVIISSSEQTTYQYTPSMHTHKQIVLDNGMVSKV